MGAIWSFINSPLGIALITAVAGKLFHSAVKSDSREKQILSYADTAFAMVELAAKADPRMKGADKYLALVKQVVNSLKASGAPELSAKEMQILQKYAHEKALIDKVPGAK